MLSTPDLKQSGEVPIDDAGYEMMRKLLKRRTRPNGVFCHSDVVAIGAMKATLDAALSIPILHRHICHDQRAI